MSEERERTDLNIPTTLRMHGFDATAEGLRSLSAQSWAALSLRIPVAVVLACRGP
jgi:hypothetical protein